MFFPLIQVILSADSATSFGITSITLLALTTFSTFVKYVSSPVFVLILISSTVIVVSTGFISTFTSFFRDSFSSSLTLSTALSMIS